MFIICTIMLDHKKVDLISDRFNKSRIELKRNQQINSRNCLILRTELIESFRCDELQHRDDELLILKSLFEWILNFPVNIPDFSLYYLSIFICKRKRKVEQKLVLYKTLSIILQFLWEGRGRPLNYSERKKRSQRRLWIFWRKSL